MTEDQILIKNENNPKSLKIRFACANISFLSQKFLIYAGIKTFSIALNSDTNNPRPWGACERKEGRMEPYPFNPFPAPPAPVSYPACAILPAIAFARQLPPLRV